MRRIFSISFITLALVMGAAGVAPAAHAGPLPEGNACPQSSTWISERDQCEYGDGSVAALVTEDEAVSQETAATAARIAKDKAAQNTALDYKPADDMDKAYGGVMQKIMSLFAWLVGVAAITLDNAVYYTVVKMGSYVHDLSAVGVTWRILRDIGNIMLIFGFLIAGIMTILNAAWYGFSSKMIPMLLAAAVFLNFSLFISEAIIDTGNLFATQFYTQINGGNPAGAKDLTLSGVLNEGISNKIMGQLGLQTIYGDALTRPEVLKAGNSWLIGFMGIILFLVTAFVMFSLAFVLIARFVILLFLIIVAPIGFAGLAIPKLGNLASQWWSKLAEQTITAPVLFLMLYIALAVITDVQFMTGFGSSSNPTGWTGFVQTATGFDNLPGFASLFLSFLVAMGLLLTVVIISKKMSAFGGDMATSVASKLSFGATAWAGRNSGGWLANKTARGLRKTWVARVPLAGTGLVKGLDKIGSASFDVRGSEAFKNIPFGGVKAGTPQKGGYKADLKGRIESRTKYASELSGKSELFAFKEKAAVRGAEDAVAKAKENRQNAEQAIAAVRGEKTNIEAEVARLTAEKRERERIGTVDFSENKKLKDASDKLAQSSTDLAAKERELAKAVDTEKEKVQEQTKAKNDLATATSSKTAQEKYAKVFELGMDEKSFFNQYVNFAANTQAAIRIRKDAGKSKEQRELERVRKMISDAADKEEKEEKTSTPPPPSSPPAP